MIKELRMKNIIAEARFNRVSRETEAKLVIKMRELKALEEIKRSRSGDKIFQKDGFETVRVNNRVLRRREVTKNA